MRVWTAELRVDSLGQGHYVAVVEAGKGTVICDDVDDGEGKGGSGEADEEGDRTQCSSEVGVDSELDIVGEAHAVVFVPFEVREW